MAELVENVKVRYRCVEYWMFENHIVYHSSKEGRGGGVDEGLGELGGEGGEGLV